MEDNKVMEIDSEIEKLKEENHELNNWIDLKNFRQKLKDKISINIPLKSNLDNNKELVETEACIKFMKRTYPAVAAYEELLSRKRETLFTVCV